MTCTEADQGHPEAGVRGVGVGMMTFCEVPCRDQSEKEGAVVSDRSTESLAVKEIPSKMCALETGGDEVQPGFFG